MCFWPTMILIFVLIFLFSKKPRTNIVIGLKHLNLVKTHKTCPQTFISGFQPWQHQLCRWIGSLVHNNSIFIQKYQLKTEIFGRSKIQIFLGIQKDRAIVLYSVSRTNTSSFSGRCCSGWWVLMFDLLIKQRWKSFQSKSWTVGIRMCDITLITNMKCEVFNFLLVTPLS